MLPPDTYETQVGHAVGDLGLDALVAWAVDAVVAGYDSPSLRILAGLQPPLDQSEVRRLYSAAFTELGIRPLPREAHGRFCIDAILRAMLGGGLDRKEAMRRAAGFDPGRDFYLLFHAKWDLERQTVQFYIGNADRSNIDQLIDDRARRWLEEHGGDETEWIRIAQNSGDAGVAWPNHD